MSSEGSNHNLFRALVRLSPLGLPFLVLFVGGLGLAVAQSLGWLLPFEHQGALLDGYRAALKPHLLASFGFSMLVALVSAGLSVGLGAVVAFVLWKLPYRLQQLSVVYKVGLILPHIAVAFVILVLWTQSGFIASIGYHLGFVKTPADFPAVLFAGNGVGMVLAYVYKETPFVILLAFSVLQRMDPRLVQTARMFGASELSVFFRVILPRLRAVLHTAFIILYLYTFGAFDIPFLVGESAPSMLSIEVYNLYFKRDLVNRPTAMAMLVLMFLFSVFFIVLYTRIAKRMGQEERKL